MDRLIVATTTSELAAFRAEVRAWITARTAGDLGRLYAPNRAQVIATGDWFESILEYFVDLLAEDPSRDTARTIRPPLFGLLKLWGTVRERLLQREAEDPRIWACADDVAHACHEPALAVARSLCGAVRLPQRPPPLVFLSYETDPHVFVAGDLPLEFERALAGDALRTLRRSWPLPMVLLPVTYSRMPWWLVMLGHEVGHAVQSELGIEVACAEVMQSAARAAGHPEPGRWAAWSGEVFADAYSVLMMGRAAIVALLGLVYDDAEAMLRRHAKHPAAAVRVELMRRLARRLDLGDDRDVAVDVTAIEVAGAEASADLGVIDAIVEVLLGPLPGLPGSFTLPQMCGHGQPSRPVDTVRQVVADNFLAYVDGQVDPGELCERTLQQIGERAGEVTRTEAAAPVCDRAVAELLLAGDWEPVP